MNNDYIFNGTKSFKTLRDHEISTQSFVEAALKFDELIHKFHEFEIDIASLLGMRNLSAFVGELYASCLIKSTGDIFKKNPHQDGYPDLLLMDKSGLDLWQTLGSRLREKAPFSPFATGGIEVKATCGDIPSAKQFTQKGLSKPDIGDQRISYVKNINWKAHHRDTNQLLGLYWDFIDRKPKIAGVFYSAELTTEDWGKIVHPTEGGGRTTSVSIMGKSGIKKMCSSWICILNDSSYIAFFEKYGGIHIVSE